MTAQPRARIGSPIFAVLCIASASADPVLTSYTTEAGFLAAVSAPATDTFNEQPLGGPIFPHVAVAGA